MRSAEIRAMRNGRSPAATGICSSSRFFDHTGSSHRLMTLNTSEVRGRARSGAPPAHPKPRGNDRAYTSP
jgi:hypothetical protein